MNGYSIFDFFDGSQQSLLLYNYAIHIAKLENYFSQAPSYRAIFPSTTTKIEKEPTPTFIKPEYSCATINFISIHFHELLLFYAIWLKDPLI